MTDEWQDADWNLFAMGALDGTTQRAMQEHLRTQCRACNRSYQEAVLVMDALAATVPQENPSPRSRPLCWRGSASRSLLRRPGGRRYCRGWRRPPARCWRYGWASGSNRCQVCSGNSMLRCHRLLRCVRPRRPPPSRRRRAHRVRRPLQRKLPARVPSALTYVQWTPK